MNRPLSQFFVFLPYRSPGHREENASPGSIEVGANMFDLIDPNIAGKHTGKISLKMLIHLAFKVFPF